MRILILSLLISTTAMAQVDMISTNSNIKYGVHFGLAGVATNNLPGLTESNASLRLQKMFGDFGFYFQVPTFHQSSLRKQFSGKPDRYAGDSDWQPRNHNLWLFYRKYLVGGTYNLDNWIAVYAGASIVNGVGYLGGEYYNSQTREFAVGYFSESATTIRPDLGIIFTPFRFLSGSVGYDMVYKNISFDVAVGWYFQADRGRSYRTRR